MVADNRDRLRATDGSRTRRLLQWNQIIRKAGQVIGRRGQLLGLLGAAQPLRELADVELVHLVFQRAQRNPQILSRRRDGPPTLFERSKNEIALEGVRSVFEQIGS